MLEIPAQFARQHLKYEKRPVYLDCQPGGVAILPDNQFLNLRALAQPDNKLREILDGLVTNAATR